MSTSSSPEKKTAKKVVPPPPLDENSPLMDFFHQGFVSALILLAAALAAMVVSNTNLYEIYDTVLHSDLGITLGAHPDPEALEEPSLLDPMEINLSLHHWINDGLMAIFFFLVGMEIKRELLVGELASFRKAFLPAAAALGGMLMPALIYSAVNFGGPGAHGWGIPMATDIAFAMGCIALLSGRVPPALAVFLVALAIVDDLGAVVVIALFYTGGVDFAPLISGGILIGSSLLISFLGVRHVIPYALIGILVWLAFLQSGVHATIAGVLLAFTIPATARYNSYFFSDRMRELVTRFEKAEEYQTSLQVNSTQQRLIRKMTRECHHVEAPLQRLEHNLHPISVFVIMPVFAFANSGVRLPFDELGALLFERVTLGIILGLVIGKPLGIVLFSWLAVKSRIAELPAGIRWNQIAGAGMLAGIGFTMSLFINGLAFTSVGAGTAHAATAEAGPVSELAARFILEGKLGIFIASIISGIVGLLYLRSVCKPGEGGVARGGH